MTPPLCENARDCSQRSGDEVVVWDWSPLAGWNIVALVILIVLFIWLWNDYLKATDPPKQEGGTTDEGQRW